MTHANETVSIPEEIDLEHILPEDFQSFYRYSGSLTTPRCDEVVTWTVFSHPNTMSSAQLKQFRTLTNDEGRPLVNNDRPPQPKRSRVVQFNQNGTSGYYPPVLSGSYPPNYQISFAGINNQYYEAIHSRPSYSVPLSKFEGHYPVPLAFRGFSAHHIQHQTGPQFDYRVPSPPQSYYPINPKPSNLFHPFRPQYYLK